MDPFLSKSVHSYFMHAFRTFSEQNKERHPSAIFFNSPAAVAMLRYKKIIDFLLSLHQNHWMLVYRTLNLTFQPMVARKLTFAFLKSSSFTKSNVLLKDGYYQYLFNECLILSKLVVFRSIRFPKMYVELKQSFV